eukprot:38337-Chlamydomonas_euryale.AAC.3
MPAIRGGPWPQLAALAALVRATATACQCRMHALWETPRSGAGPADHRPPEALPQLPLPPHAHMPGPLAAGPRRRRLSRRCRRLPCCRRRRRQRHCLPVAAGFFGDPPTQLLARAMRAVPPLTVAHGAESVAQDAPPASLPRPARVARGLPGGCRHRRCCRCRRCRCCLLRRRPLCPQNRHQCRHRCRRMHPRRQRRRLGKLQSAKRRGGTSAEPQRRGVRQRRPQRALSTRPTAPIASGTGQGPSTTPGGSEVACVRSGKHSVIWWQEDQKRQRARKMEQWNRNSSSGSSISTSISSSSSGSNNCSSSSRNGYRSGVAGSRRPKWAPGSPSDAFGHTGFVSRWLNGVENEGSLLKLVEAYDAGALRLRLAALGAGCVTKLTLQAQYLKRGRCFKGGRTWPVGCSTITEAVRGHNEERWHLF